MTKNMYKDCANGAEFIAKFNKLHPDALERLTSVLCGQIHEASGIDLFDDQSQFMLDVADTIVKFNKQRSDKEKSRSDSWTAVLVVMYMCTLMQLIVMEEMVNTRNCVNEMLTDDDIRNIGLERDELIISAAKPALMFRRDNLLKYLYRMFNRSINEVTQQR